VQKTKPNEFLFNGLVRSVLWNETVQRAAAAMYELTRGTKEKTN